MLHSEYFAVEIRMPRKNKTEINEKKKKNEMEKQEKNNNKIIIKKNKKKVQFRFRCLEK